VDLTEASTVAGRAPENKIVIDDKQASRRHFSIDKIEYGFKLVDLESRNGTRVNDRQVNQMLLRPGDRIVIGKYALTFEDPSFKEPPPEVAAKLGPPPVAGRVDPPSTAPDSGAAVVSGYPAGDLWQSSAAMAALISSRSSCASRCRTRAFWPAPIPTATSRSFQTSRW
jgi:pSer/pThr/pTyr-binding forkhead associated (FHA) protein